MKTFKLVLAALAMMLSLPIVAQDFGYPKEKAFYKAHWNEIVKDLGGPDMLFNAQYVLFDFDKDNSAELYVWRTPNDEILYSIKGNKVVRVSETARPVEDQFWLGPFYAHFMAPYEMLFDKPVNKHMATEQHLYDIFDVPGIWFKLHPKVEGTFNIKSALEALYCFDCDILGDALYALSSGNYDKSMVADNGYVVDVQNGYAMISYKGESINMVEACYWNLPTGEKLLALHYHISCKSSPYDGIDWFEQILFMKYNPKTKYLTPVVAPIQGYDFLAEYNFSLPRKGKNIKLIGADDRELVWTGKGFRY